MANVKSFMSVLRRRAASFGHAFAGLRLLFGHEPNAKLHAAAACLAAACGAAVGLSAVEWAAVVICIGVVMAAEAFNTAVERLADRLVPERDEDVKAVKDVAAGGVLLAATAAAVVGALVFLPKIILVLKNI